LKGQVFREIKEGDIRAFSKTITEQDLETFARLTGDFNPIHMDDNFSKKTIFEGRVAHGILIAGLISAAVSKLPGVVIYRAQNLVFLKPVRVGDTIEAVVEILGKVKERHELKARTSCKNQRGEMVVDGEAIIKISEIIEEGHPEK
jgi:3-hydroxybutyryl-CoA dehydratase